MQGFKVCGDVKVVTLTIRAIAYFHKTVQGFLTAIKNLRPNNGRGTVNCSSRSINSFKKSPSR